MRVRKGTQGGQAPLFLPHLPPAGSRALEPGGSGVPTLQWCPPDRLVNWPCGQGKRAAGLWEH